MHRKEFIAGIAGLGAGIACLSLLNACNKSNKDSTTPAVNNGTNSNDIDFTIDLDDPANNSLNTAGGFLYKIVSNTSIVIINMGNNQFNAINRVCSHANCLVNYDAVSQKLPCPCHGSRFDIHGTVLNGPATKPLTKYNTALNGSLLHIFAS